MSAWKFEPPADGVGRIRRVYLETNVLSGRWPSRISHELAAIAQIAKDVGVAICIPRSVVVEHQNSVIRRVLEHLRSAEKQLGSVDSLMNGVLPTPTLTSVPDDRVLAKAYDDAAEKACREHGFKITQTTVKGVEDFVRMSAQHVPPFKDEDRGFRDSVHLHSAIEHIRQSPVISGGVCVFMTADKRLGMDDVHRMCARLLDDIGVSLLITDDLKVIKEDLATQLKAPDKMRWVTAVERLRKAVEPQLNVITPDLLKGLPKVQLGHDIDVQEADEGVLRNVGDMSTGVVVAGADVPFSCKALLDVRDAWVVESFAIPAGIKANLRTVDFTLTISIEGNATPVHATGDIKSFVVESVLADSVSWGDSSRDGWGFDPPLQLLSSPVYVGQSRA